MRASLPAGLPPSEMSAFWRGAWTAAVDELIGAGRPPTLPNPCRLTWPTLHPDSWPTPCLWAARSESGQLTEWSLCLWVPRAARSLSACSERANALPRPGVSTRRSPSCSHATCYMVMAYDVSTTLHVMRALPFASIRPSSLSNRYPKGDQQEGVAAARLPGRQGGPSGRLPRGAMGRAS